MSGPLASVSCHGAPRWRPGGSSNKMLGEDRNVAKLTAEQKAKLAERINALSPDEKEAVVEVLSFDILKILGKGEPAKEDEGILKKLFGV